MRSTTIIAGCVLLAGTAAHAADLQLRASDGAKVLGTLTTAATGKAAAGKRRVALLFHQARSNRHEYDPIVPALRSAGFDTLAIDQRSGGTMWGQVNQTVRARGGSGDYLSALADLEGALAWATKHKYGTILAVGSSYSAGLLFLLAQRHPRQLAAIAAFSPGEYLGQPHRVKNAASKLQLPIYVTAGSSKGEQALVDEVCSKVKGRHLTRYRPTKGVHGASTLRRDRNPQGAQANLKHFVAFVGKLTRK